MSLLPLFIEPELISIRDGAYLFGLAIVAIGSVKIAYAYAAAKLGSSLLNIDGKNRFGFLNQIAGGLMIGAGGSMMIKS